MPRFRFFGDTHFYTVLGLILGRTPWPEVCPCSLYFTV